MDGMSLLHFVSGFADVQSAHRDQGQPEVTELGQQAVQCRLIGERARNDRLGAVPGDLEAAEPIRPMVIEDTVNADLVPARPSWVAHGRPPARLGVAGTFPVSTEAAVMWSSLRTAIAIPPAARV
jgi:hypothetical protein